MKCLAKAPADRWQSAEELLNELEPLSTFERRIGADDEPPGGGRGCGGRSAAVPQRDLGRGRDRRRRRMDRDARWTHQRRSGDRVRRALPGDARSRPGARPRALARRQARRVRRRAAGGDAALREATEQRGDAGRAGDGPLGARAAMESGREPDPVHVTARSRGGALPRRGDDTAAPGPRDPGC